MSGCATCGKRDRWWVNKINISLSQFIKQNVDKEIKKSGLLKQRR